VIGPAQNTLIDRTAGYSEFQSGPLGPAYNEAAFRHFLAMDQARAQRSQRFLYLVLLALRESPGRRARLTDSTSAALFRGLGSSVREVDYVGWYHEGRVAAAVLAQGVEATGNVATTVAARLVASMKKTLPAAQLADLRVRIVRLGGRKNQT
jgi:hypothetical protein